MNALNTEITQHIHDTLQKYTCALLRDVMPEFYGIKTGRVKELINPELPDVKVAPPGIKSDTLVYNPHIIFMGNYNGDTIYSELNAKIKAGQELDDKEVLNLIFLPLMKHTIPRKELAAKTIELAQTISDTTKRHTCIAAAYAFAHRYLDEAESKKILEVLRMTDLGAMLVGDALRERDIEFAKKLLKRNTPIEIIMEDTGLDEFTIERLQAEMNQL